MTFIQRLARSLHLESLSRLFREFLSYKRTIGLVLVLGLVVAAVQPACVKLTQWIVDDLKEGTGKGIIQWVPWFLVGLFAINGLAKYFHRTLRRYVTESIVVKIRADLYGKYLNAPLSFIDKKRTGELLSKMQNDLVQIGAGMDTMCEILREPFTFMGLIAVAFYCDWQLTALTLVVAPLVVLLFSLSGAAVKRYSGRNLAQFSDLISLGQETLVGSRIVKVFRLENVLAEKFQSIHDRYFKTLWKSIRIQELSTPLVEFVGAILIALVVVYGGYRVSAGIITTGELIAFIIAIGLAQMPIKNLNNAI